jgi:ankyrin repeat protein
MIRWAIFFIVLNFSTMSFADCQYDDFIRLIQLGNNEGVKQYIDAGCDVKASTPSAISALELSLILNRIEIFNQLVNADKKLIELDGVDTLVAACNINIKNKPVIELLVAQGVNINARSINGFSCLYNAAVTPDPDFFNYLLTLGADPEAKVVPDPSYQINRLISVKDFISTRSAAYGQLERAIVDSSDKAIVKP